MRWQNRALGLHETYKLRDQGEAEVQSCVWISPCQFTLQSEIKFTNLFILQVHNHTFTRECDGGAWILFPFYASLYTTVLL